MCRESPAYQFQKFVPRRYSLERIVGHGGAALVFSAFDRAAQQHVAVKICNRDTARIDPEILKFEFNILSRLRHPHILQVLDFGMTDPAHPFIVTELIASLAFNTFKQRRTTADVREYLVQALNALAYLHAQGIVHGDIKPDNLLLQQTGKKTFRMRVADFGLSGKLNRGSSVFSGGTFPYIAPEALRAGKVQPASDLFALGVILIELITGQTPFNTMSQYQAYIMNGNREMHLPKQKPWNNLTRLAKRLTHIDPEKRFLSAREALHFLESGGEKPHRERGYSVPARFCGRDAILSRLAALAAESAEGKWSQIHIYGREQSGKSRLLNEFGVQCRLKGMTVHAASCRDTGLFNDLNTALMDVFNTPVVSVRQALARIREYAGKTGFVLLLDDFFHSDIATQETIMQLLALKPPGMMIITSGIRPFPESARNLQLAPLEPAQAEQLVKSRFVPSIDPECVSRIVEYAGYLPGRLNRAVDFLLENRNVYFTAGKWRWNPEKSADFHPADVFDLKAQFRKLDAQDRRILGVMACCGRELDITALSRILELKQSQLITALRRFGKSYILKFDSEFRTFVDGFTQQAAAALLTESESANVHAKAAELLAEIPGMESAAGRHYLAAGLVDSALPLLFSAGRTVRKSGSLRSALEIFHQIQLAAENIPISPEIASLLLKTRVEAGNAYLQLGETDRAVAVYSEALESSAAQPDSALKSNIHGNLALAYMQKHSDKSAAHHLEIAGQIARKIDNRQLEAQHLVNLGNLHLKQNRIAAAESCYLSAVNCPGLHENKRILSTAWNNLGIIFEMKGDFSRALESYEKSAEIRTAANDRRGAAILYHNIGHLLLECGNLNRAIRHFETADEMLSGTGEIRLQAQVWTSFAQAKLTRGDIRGAWKLLEKADAAVRGNLPDSGILLHILSHRAQLLMSCGKPQSAFQLLDDNLAMLPENRPLNSFEQVFARYYALAAARSGNSIVPLSQITDSNTPKPAEDPVSSCERHVIQAEQFLYSGRTNDADREVRIAVSQAEKYGLRLKHAQALWVAGKILCARNQLDSAADILTNEKLYGFLCDQKALLPVLHWLGLIVFIRKKQGYRKGIEALQAEFEKYFSLVEVNVPDVLDSRELFEVLTGRDITVPSGIAGAQAKLKSGEATEEEMENQEKLRLLLEVTQAIHQERSLDTLLRLIVDRALELTGADRGFCYLKPTDAEPEILICRNISREKILGENSQISTSVLKQVLESGRPVHVRDTLADAQFKNRKSILAWNLRTVLCAALPRIGLTGEIRSRETMGALYVDGKASTSEFRYREQEIFQALAAQAAVGIENVRLRSRLFSENKTLKHRIADKYRVGAIIGTSEPMLQIHRMIEKVARSDANILILGESGTGKELVAQTIHYNGPRAEFPFLGINCAALSETMLESELFGVESGVATGVTRRAGLFVMADKGTLLLDEAANMSLSMQAKILRVLQERKVRPVGGKRSISIDVRILCASNKDLWEEVRSGRFREDLLFRLDVISIRVPPLRERVEDIGVLARHFIRKFARKAGVPVPEIAPETMKILESYSWPGNVRELENQMERVIILSDPGRSILPEDLSPRLLESQGGQDGISLGRLNPDGNRPMKEVVREIERMMILDALEKENGNRIRTAHRLGLSREGLRLKLARLNIGFPSRSSK